MIGGGSTKDIMAFTLPLTHQTTKGPYGRAARPTRIDPGENTKVFLVSGQSLASAWNGGSYIPTNTAKVDQINIEDGGCYAFADPPLGIDSGISGSPSATGTWMGRLGDELISGGHCDRVIFVPCAVGGTEIAKFRPGGLCYQRLLVASRRVAALGLTVNAVLFQQGEADNQLATTQAAYQASALAMREGLASEGFFYKWILAKSTVIAGVSYAPVRAAVDAMVDNSNIFLGPDFDGYIGLTYRLADNTHLSSTGLDVAGPAWKNAVVSAGV